MADRIQRLIRSLESSNSRVRFYEPASQSQRQRSVQRSQTVQRSPTVQRSQLRTQPVVVVEEDEEEGVIPLQEDSDAELGSDSGSQGFEVENDEEDEEGEEIGSEEDEEDDEEVDVMAEGQNQQQEVTVAATAAAAASQLGQANCGGGMRSCSMVGAVFNGASGAVPVVLTDPDVLDCPICLDPLSTPIFQCQNGHITCSSCCSKAKSKCPSCCKPIGHNRCLAMEKLIESVRIECKNTKFGCKETLSYSKKNEHELICAYAACFCPHSPCTFAGSSKNLYLHFRTHHSYSAIYFTYGTAFFIDVEKDMRHIFLQEQNENTIFILNHDYAQDNGRLLNIDCIGPGTLKSAFAYHIISKRVETSVSLQSAPDIYPKWCQHTPKKNYLTVPSSLLGYNGLVTIKVCIKKAHSIV